MTKLVLSLLSAWTRFLALSVAGTLLLTATVQGAVVTVQDVPLDGNRLVDVLWDGKLMMMFAIDLKQRGTLVS